MKIKNQMSESFFTVAFLSLSGGLQDAYTYLSRGKVFANAQTGNIVLLAQNLFEKNFRLSLRYFIPIFSFALGVAAAEIIKLFFKDEQTIHWRQYILFSEIILLLVVGFLPEKLNLLANAIVSFSCAMQVQAFRKVDGKQFSSTMCIGNIRSAMESFILFIKTRQKAQLSSFVFYLGVILCFALGAVLGDFLFTKFSFGTIWFSCGLLLISLLLMFIKTDKENKSARI